MHDVLSVKGICNWSLEKSFYLSILLFTLLLSLGLCYCQFLRLYNEKEEQLQKEMHFVKNEMEKESAAYKAMLDFISKNITDKNLIKNQHAISALLKNVYISEHEAHGKIGFSDISWYNASNNVAINRYGAMQTTKPFPADLENSLRALPKVMHLYALKNKAKIPSVKELYFAMGVTNSKGEYIGKLAILLNMEPWVSSLKERLSKTADIIAIINNQQDVLLSTDENLRNSTINVPLKLTGSQVNVPFGDYIFLYYAEFAQSPYVVMYGYNKQALVQKLIKANASVISALWMSTLLF